MYSFKKEIKFLDEKEEEQVKHYEFFSFTQSVTSPNINKYTNYGEKRSFSMVRYHNDFLGLNLSYNNLFYIEYVGGFSENYEVYDGSFLMYKNMSVPFDDPDIVEETVQIEMPISPREEENIELKSITYQTGVSEFATLYYFKGSISGLNNLKASLTLPKELQIREFLRPREITQENFNELISDLEEESSMESLQDELYKIVDDDGDLVEFRLLSYTKNNLINKIVDYDDTINSVDTTNESSRTHENLNKWFTTNTLPAMRTLNFAEEGVTSVSYGHRDYHPNRTLEHTYDGYSTLTNFIGELAWNGGYFQNYGNTSLKFSGVTRVQENEINNTDERVLLINSYINYT